MISSRIFLVWAMVLGVFGAQATTHPKPPTTADTEARNETAAPSFAGQVYEARRISSFLADALMLNNAQQHALLAYTTAKCQALALAVTAAEVEQAQQQYLQAVRRVLCPTQRDSYAALCRRLTGTLLPLDGSQLALR